MAITNLFAYLANLDKIWIILSEFKLSNPDVGSSKTKHIGSEISYTPITTLFFCPPEIDFFNLPPTNEFLI